MTSKESIIAKIRYEGCYLAIHEFKQGTGALLEYSENNIATRLSELVKDGILFCRYRKSERFKEWGLAEWENKIEVRELKTGQMVWV